MPRKAKKGAPPWPPAAGEEKGDEIRDLLGDSDEEGGGEKQKEGQLSINKAFAERYEQRKRKELLSKHTEALQELSGEAAKP